MKEVVTELCGSNTEVVVVVTELCGSSNTEVVVVVVVTELCGITLRERVRVTKRNVNVNDKFWQKVFSNCEKYHQE